MSTIDARAPNNSRLARLGGVLTHFTVAVAPATAG
jgi:hypothetical protein